MKHEHIPHERLRELREAGWDSVYPAHSTRVTVGMSTCGIAAGAAAIRDAFCEALQPSSLDIRLYETGCKGFCWAEPVVEVQLPGWYRAVYGPVEITDIPLIIDGIARRRLPHDKLIGYHYRDWSELFDTAVELADGDRADIDKHPFQVRQSKRLTATWGHLQPTSIEEYAAFGGFTALDKALAAGDSLAVIDAVERSGLRGRGGAGFPTGRKMRSAAEASSVTHYVIANADEGDPGAYMDRGLLESDTFRVLEGLILAAFSVGAHQGLVFTRSEYPLAIETLHACVAVARDHGFLGENILDSGFGFDVAVVCSAGAYVCGETSAMVSALEGRRPDPFQRQPHLTEKGLWGQSTLVLNVETLANIPSIVAHGPKRYRSQGTERSPGTKVFSLAGPIAHVGLVEVEMGMPLRDMVEEIGVIDDAGAGRHVLSDPDIAVQVGGPSGAILPLTLEGLTLDYEGLNAAGGIIGSGGVVVLGKATCVVDIARYFLQFSYRESCGKCTPCREGLALCCDIMDSLVSGKAQPTALAQLESLCAYISANSLCGLGKMAPTPLLSSMRLFQQEYREHLDGRCPSIVCQDLIHFMIDPEKCLPSCTSCLPSCPTGAIKGHYGQRFTIRQELCTKCWMCTAQCPYGALEALPCPAIPL